MSDEMKFGRGGIRFGPSSGGGPRVPVRLGPGARATVESMMDYIVEAARLRRENARLRSRLARVLAASRGLARVTMSGDAWSLACWRPRGQAWSGRAARGAKR